MGSLAKHAKRTSTSKALSSEPTAADHGPDVLYRIDKSDVVGRYMVADRDIEPGEVIFTDQPACIGPDNSSKPMCLGCHRKVNGTYKCPSCRWPMCRQACTRLPIHAAECALFSLRKGWITVPWFDKPCAYYDAILPIRVLLLKMHNPKVYQLVSLLMDHGDSLEESTKKHRQRIVDFIRKSCKLGNDFSESEVHHVLGILSVNSFVVHDTTEGNYDLIGLYPWTSLMSHHCIANTKITTREDFSYSCEATTFIPAGSEIVTSYHHYHYQFYGTAYRRLDLKNTWSFDCNCRRCADPTEGGTQVSAIVCDSCKFGYQLPKVSTTYESAWLCDHCGAESAGKDVESRLKRFEDEIDDIAADNAAEFERLLRKMRYFLHENHYWVLDVKRRLIDIYGNKDGFELYKLDKDTLERKIDFCEHLLSIAAVLCPGASEMRAYLLWESHGAKYRLVQWKWLRMRITTPVYLTHLRELSAGLREVIAIFGPIRLDSDEGQMGARAREELRSIENLIREMSRQTFSVLSSVNSSSTTTLNLLDNLKDSGDGQTNGSGTSLSRTHRRSICI